MRVAIVGAGSAGMAMAKQLKEVTGAQTSFVLFERRSEVGGIWQYDGSMQEPHLAWERDDGSLEPLWKRGGRAGTSRLRIAWQEARPPGPMFEGLRTNIPADLMSYRDALFPPDTNLYPSRECVQRYLEAYATEHDLRRHVRFDTVVKRIVKDADEVGWIVESEGLGGLRTESFTHVALAHGRCATPNIPNIPGLHTFTGRTLHSAWYRDPTTLLRPGEARRVLVVGNASSGMDIARELVGFLARTLPCGLSPDEWAAACEREPFEVLSSWHAPDKPPPMDYSPLEPTSPEWCKRIQVVESITAIDGPRVHLADGRTLDDVPLILFATGYLFDNAFLDQTVGALRRFPLLPPAPASPTRRGIPSSSLYNLDDWLLLHAHDETLALLGLPITVVPFPFTEVQACYVAHRWIDEASKLPLLDRSLLPSDEARWTSRRPAEDVDAQPASGDEPVLNTTTHVFGKPSDTVHLDLLLSMIRQGDPAAGEPVPWLSQYTSDGRGEGEPRGPEARYATSPWRVERRNAGRLLRRETLGY